MDSFRGIYSGLGWRDSRRGEEKVSGTNGTFSSAGFDAGDANTAIDKPETKGLTQRREERGTRRDSFNWLQNHAT